MDVDCLKTCKVDILDGRGLSYMYYDTCIKALLTVPRIEEERYTPVARETRTEDFDIT